MFHLFSEVVYTCISEKTEIFCYTKIICGICNFVLLVEPSIAIGSVLNEDKKF